jgi:hypothetical protein
MGNAIYDDFVVITIDAADGSPIALPHAHHVPFTFDRRGVGA